VQGQGEVLYLYIWSNTPNDAAQPFRHGFSLAGNPHEGDFRFVCMHFKDFAGHTLQFALDLVRSKDAGLAHAGSKMAMVST
jgi:hypothetical protein